MAPCCSVTVVRAAVGADLPAIRHLADVSLEVEPMPRAALADLLYRRPPRAPRLRLVADTGGEVVGFAFGSVHSGVGYVDAIAVRPDRTRRGIGTSLLAALEAELLRARPARLQIGGNTWYYAWPGIDLRYTGARRLAERAGYAQREIAQNMDVSLAGWISGTADDVLRRHGSRVVVRRAVGADRAALAAFVRERFDEVWRHEADLAVHRDVPTAFLAARDDRIVGFACHGVYRADWFGPIGVDPGERGTGSGEALLRACLDDLAAAGVPAAQIGWIGPQTFYERTVGARLGRRFAILDKPVE